jgi:predicted membrane GTPase involved in stress response
VTSSRARAGSGKFGAIRGGDKATRGLRVIYYLFLQDSLIWLVTLYGKDEAADLTPSEKRLLKAAADEEKRQRAKRPLLRRK